MSRSSIIPRGPGEIAPCASLSRLGVRAAGRPLSCARPGHVIGDYLPSWRNWRRRSASQPVGDRRSRDATLSARSASVGAWRPDKAWRQAPPSS